MPPRRVGLHSGAGGRRVPAELNSVCLICGFTGRELNPHGELPGQSMIESVRGPIDPIPPYCVMSHSAEVSL